MPNPPSGVTAASVSFATGQATVDCTEEVAPERLVQAVEKAGYGARVPQAARLAEMDAEAEAAQADRWRKAFFALAVAVPAVLRMVPGVLPHAWMTPLDRALLVVSIPVLAWSGGGFFRRTARNLSQGVFVVGSKLGGSVICERECVGCVVIVVCPNDGDLFPAELLGCLPCVVAGDDRSIAVFGNDRLALSEALKRSGNCRDVAPAWIAGQRV
jgi:hypothetical protein